MARAQWPHFWVPRGPAGLHEYGLRLPFEETPTLPTRLPAEVNAHEARAYATWLGRRLEGGAQHDRVYRLTTEAEHHRIRELAAAEGGDDAPSGGPYRSAAGADGLNVRSGEGVSAGVGGSCGSRGW